MAFNDEMEAWKAQGISPTQKLILLCLAKHRHGKKDELYNLCCPSQDTVAELTGLDEGCVSKNIRELGKAGKTIIDKDPQCRRSTRYYFPWNENPELTQSTQSCAGQPRADGSSSELITSAQSCPGQLRADVVSPNKEHNQEGEPGTESVERNNDDNSPPAAGAAAAVTSPEEIQKQNQDGASARDEVSALAEQFYLWMGKAKKADVSKGIRKFPALLSKHPGLFSHLRFVFENPCASKLKDNLLASVSPFAYLDSCFLDGVQDRRDRYESKMEKHRQDVARKAAAAAASGTDRASIEDIEEEGFGTAAAPASGTDGTAIRNLEDEEDFGAEESSSDDMPSLELEA